MIPCACKSASVVFGTILKHDAEGWGVASFGALRDIPKTNAKETSGGGGWGGQENKAFVIG